MNYFGDRIKQLREERSLLQKHIASKLDIDTPMISKIERGERKAKREQVLLFASIFHVSQTDLLTLWLADQVYDVVNDEDVALNAMHLAEGELKIKKTKSNIRLHGNK